MPRKGKEWDQVEIIELKDKLCQYKYYNHFSGAGASCIRKHFLYIHPACREVNCKVDEEVL